MLSNERLQEISERVHGTAAYTIYAAVMQSPYKTTEKDDFFAEHAVDDVRKLLDTVAELKEIISEMTGDLADATGQTRAEIELAYTVPA